MRRHRRFPPVNQQEQVSSVMGHTGNPAKRWAPPPVLSDPEGGSPLRNIALGRVPWLDWDVQWEVIQQEETLVPHPLLTWTLNTFGRVANLAGRRRREGPPVMPVAQTSPGWPLQVDWVAWQCVDMLAWWRELWVIPDIEDQWELTQNMRASFEVPMGRYQPEAGEMITPSHWPQSALERIGFCHPWNQEWIVRTIT